MKTLQKVKESLLVSFVFLWPNICAGQTPKNNKSGDTIIYFTVLNHGYIGYTHPEMRIDDIDLSNGTPLYAQQYFQDFLFYSGKSKRQVLFEVFLTVNRYIRKKKFFKNHDTLSNYFKNKYNISFFYDSEEEKNKRITNSFGYLERVLTYDDFNDIIKNNLNIELIKTTSLTQPTKTATYVLVYNWDFFEELVLYPKMNSLLAYIHDLPFTSPLSSNNIIDLQIKALSNLDVWSYVTDSRIKGLMFKERDLKKYKCDHLKLPFIECFKTDTGYIIEPKTRDFMTVYETHYQNNDLKFSRDFQLMLDFFSQKMIPFKILEKPFTKY